MTRHVVVTGASSGIGAACAQAFAAKGDRLTLGARRTDRLPQVVDGASCHQLDVTDAASVAAFVDAAVAANGPIDVLVNNAGLARGTEQIAEGTGEAWREMIETNVLGLLEVTRRVLPHMIEHGGGHVVVIGSIAGHKAYVGGGVYCGGDGVGYDGRGGVPRPDRRVPSPGAGQLRAGGEPAGRARQEHHAAVAERPALRRRDLGREVSAASGRR